MARPPRGAAGALLTGPATGARSRGGPPPPLLVGQSLELWRPPLAGAVRARERAPLQARAARQLAAGADALDLNAGAGLDREPARLGDDLVWAAEAVRAAHPGVALWLDCGSHEALLRALPAVPAPVAVNAVFLGTAGAAALLRAALERGAGVVLSPLSSDRGAPLSVEALIEVAVAAAAELAGHGAAAAWLDCLAPPASSDRGRLERSLALARRLAREPAPAPRLRPLLAVGNVGHGAPGGARPALRAVYAAAATGAGAAALIAPLEQAALRAAVAVAGGARPPAGAAERWLRDVAAAAATGAPLPAPGSALVDASPRLGTAWELLAG